MLGRIKLFRKLALNQNNDSLPLAIYIIFIDFKG